MEIEGLVSVIVPVYNAEQTITRCVDSVLNQTYEDIELILINDGSYDQTDEICRSISEQHRRVTYLIQENAGPSAARNVGLSNCNGEYVTFLDSDDTFDQSAVSNLVHAIQKADLVVAGYTNSTEYKENAGLHPVIPEQSEKVLSKKDFLICFSDLFESNLIHYIWHKLYRADCIGDLRFDESLNIGEDLIFNLNYFDKINHICLIDEIVTYHAKDNQHSLTKTFQPDLLDYRLTVYSSTKDFLVSNNSWTENNAETLNRYFAKKLYTAIKNYYQSSSPLSFSQRVGLSKRIIDEPTIQNLNRWFEQFSFSAKCLSILIRRKKSRTFALAASVYFSYLS